jgi:hypothetical protein
MFSSRIAVTAITEHADVPGKKLQDANVPAQSASPIHGHHEPAERKANLKIQLCAVLFDGCYHVSVIEFRQ